MHAVVSVIGKDKVGIIAMVSNLLAKLNINIEDISQTVLKDSFTMIMMVNIEKANKNFKEISDILNAEGEKNELVIRIQHQDIFNCMHKL